MARVLIFLSLLFAIGFHMGVVSAAEPSFPALTGRVVDDAHILDAAARAAIERKLAAFVWLHPGRGGRGKIRRGRRELLCDQFVPDESGHVTH